MYATLLEGILYCGSFNSSATHYRQGYERVLRQSPLGGSSKQNKVFFFFSVEQWPNSGLSHPPTHTHIYTHTRWDSSERVISSSQHNTKQTQETNIHALSGIRNRELSIRRLQTHALDRTATAGNEHKVP